MPNSTASIPEESYDSTGFLTYQLSSLPVAIRVILTLLCVVVGLGLCSVSPYAARWGTQWQSSTSTRGRADGLERGNKWKFRLAGGVLGIFTGGLGSAYTILLLSFAVLSTQDDPSFSPWAIIAVSLISAAIGVVIGGRWKAMSRLFLTFIGSISITLLFSTSFRIKAKLGRLIIFFIIFIITLVTSFIFSLLPRSTLQHISNRIAIFLSTTTGAWLVCGIGIDILAKTGLLDAPTLLASQSGIFEDNPYEVDGADVRNVVRWNEGRCRGLLAGMWLLIVVGTAFQQWRYSMIGDDPEESWNTYLGSLLSNDKTLISRSRNTNNPNSGGLLDNNRAGVFSKSENWLKRMFRSSSEKKRRMMPATYMLPSEQEGNIPNENSTPALHGDYEQHGEGLMSEVHSPGNNDVRRPNAPAKYDSFGYLTVGLGLYDSDAQDPREAYYAAPYDDEPNSSRGVYDARGGRSNLLPTYNPDLYSQEHRQGLPRHDSEPSFQSVPKYSPPRIENMVESQSMPFEREGTFANRIVEEPEHNQRDRRQNFIAPLSPQARASEGRLQSRVAAEEEGMRSVPIPATPSLVNAIQRISEAQAQARQYRIQEQQAQLSASYSSPITISRGEAHDVASPSPTAVAAGGSINHRIPEHERIALKQAAIRRQASAEWWSEVERKANEQAHRERSPGPVSFNRRISSLPHAGSNGPAARSGSSSGWRSSSAGYDRGKG